MERINSSQKNHPTATSFTFLEPDKRDVTVPLQQFSYIVSDYCSSATVACTQPARCILIPIVWQCSDSLARWLETFGRTLPEHPLDKLWKKYASQKQMTQFLLPTAKNHGMKERKSTWKIHTRQCRNSEKNKAYYYWYNIHGSACWLWSRQPKCLMFATDTRIRWQHVFQHGKNDRDSMKAQSMQ